MRHSNRLIEKIKINRCANSGNQLHQYSVVYYCTVHDGLGMAFADLNTCHTTTTVPHTNIQFTIFHMSQF